MTLLDIDRITMQFGGVTAVDEVSLRINRGEIVSVIGPNGAGKTTLFNAVTGVYSPTKGSISLNGEPLAHRPGVRDFWYALGVALITGIFFLFLFHIQSAWDQCINALYVYEEPFDWLLSRELLGQYWQEQSWLSTWGIGLVSALLSGAAYGVIRTQGIISPEKIVRFGIARTFQNIRLFRSMSALEVVLSGSQLRAGPDHRRRIVKESLELLSFVGLRTVTDRGATTLSYGDQRRLEIARALATKPEILLLDEPAAGMNEAETERLGELIEAIRDRGVTVVLIEHHMNLVMAVSDRVVVMQNGRVLAEGTPAEIQQDEAVIAAYLGNDLDG
jgi:ABC-type branched-subunit amino acid transport system ATPase component